MPYIHPLADDDKEALRTKAGQTKTHDALKFFTSKGYEYPHRDLCWRHIGRAPLSDRVSPGRIVLIDLVSSMVPSTQ
jgi:hypothetical protein